MINIYEAERMGQDTVSYGIFNDDDILLAYGEYHDEMAQIARGRVIVTLSPEHLAEELEKAKSYYGVR